MTLPELYERVVSLISGGAAAVDTRLERGYVYSLIHSARAQVITERFKMQGSVPPIYYQPFKPEYVVLSQNPNGCYSKFYNVPAIIAIDGRSTGLGFIGGDEALCMFREVNNRAELASMMTNRLAKKLRKPIALILGGGEMEVYSQDSIESIRMEAVFADPTTVDTYNIDYDDYPMDMGDIARLEALLLQSTLNAVSKTPMDRINDQRDTTVQPQPRM